MSKYLLAIDQGTTNSRAHIFSHTGDLIGSHEMALTQYYPHEGWVEQDPEQIWGNTVACCQQALKQRQLVGRDIAAVGITNQRETTVIWDKKTGQPIYPAIVWQDRRTAALCAELKQHPISKQLQDKTGLLLDPYFSATKIMWLLEHVSGARARAERGELLFGTIDTFLLWRLTKGKVHATDATNASRTLLFNIRTQQWDADILQAFNIPSSLLPTVLDSCAEFGDIDPEFLGTAIPITSMIGDQQAATVGQACFTPGMAKSTYGTGCFIMLNTGNNIIRSQHDLLSTVLYRLRGQVTYGLEGSIFCAGTTIKWLRDKLNIIKTAAESETLAQSIENTGGVYFIPAFVGLGAPYWNPHVRAAIMGLTGGSSPAHIVRAALEAVAYQSRDLITAMANDSKTALTTLRIDGGMAANNWLLQFTADMLNVTVCRPACIETTALGAAYLAGLHIGIYQSLNDIAHLWKANREFSPQMNNTQSDALYVGWQKAIQCVLAT